MMFAEPVIVRIAISDTNTACTSQHIINAMGVQVLLTQEIAIPIIVLEESTVPTLMKLNRELVETVVKSLSCLRECIALLVRLVPTRSKCLLHLIYNTKLNSGYCSTLSPTYDPQITSSGLDTCFFWVARA
ncbi:hypothetical protein QCA50_014365 [Cerrena zonata]|uniref:Uncharacterized protein n=1 Tax=Cerrena zonata TaxID=2478898 RepID=A0AAW0FUN3_9APHY